MKDILLAYWPYIFVAQALFFIWVGHKWTVSLEEPCSECGMLRGNED